MKAIILIALCFIGYVAANNCLCPCPCPPGPPAPPGNGGDAICAGRQVYHPHATDCNRFIQCTNGRAHEHTCPSNLHFNTRLNVCDWPDRAGCTLSRF